MWHTTRQTHILLYIMQTMQGFSKALNWDLSISYRMFKINLRNMNELNSFWFHDAFLLLVDFFVLLDIDAVVVLTGYAQTYDYIT